jgi:hypothetical protein
MIARILSLLFPPRPGRIKDIDTVMLATAIRQGEIEVYEGEDSWAGQAFEWRKDHWHPMPRIDEWGE